jgi:hypothetical protein
LFSFILPKTPPTIVSNEKRVGDLLGLDALKLLKDRNFAIFLFHQFLFVSPRLLLSKCASLLTRIENPTGKMAIGQISKLYSYC